MPTGATMAGAPFVLRTPSLAAAPGVSLPTAIANPNYRPIVMRPAGVMTAGPPTVISSPGLARMPTATAGSMRPVFIGTCQSYVKEKKRDMFNSLVLHRHFTGWQGIDRTYLAPHTAMGICFYHPPLWDSMAMHGWDVHSSFFFNSVIYPLGDSLFMI